MRIALNGMSAGLMHLEREKEPVELLLRLPLRRTGRYRLAPRDRHSRAAGRLVSLSELVQVQARTGG